MTVERDLLFRLIWGLMDESLIRFMAIFDAAGPVAGLTAAPACSSRQAGATFVMPAVINARDSYFRCALTKKFLRNTPSINLSVAREPEMGCPTP